MWPFNKRFDKYLKCKNGAVRIKDIVQLALTYDTFTEPGAFGVNDEMHLGRLIFRNIILHIDIGREHAIQWGYDTIETAQGDFKLFLSQLEAYQG